MDRHGRSLQGREPHVSRASALRSGLRARLSGRSPPASQVLRARLVMRRQGIPRPIASRCPGWVSPPWVFAHVRAHPASFRWLGGASGGCGGFQVHCTGPDRTPLFRVPPPSSCPWAKRHGCLRAIAVHSRSGIQQFTPAVVPEDGLSSTSTAYPWRGAGSGPRPNPVTLCLGGSLGRLRRVVTPLTGCCRLCLRAGRGDPGLGWLFPRQPSWFQLRRKWLAGGLVVLFRAASPRPLDPPHGP